MTAHDRSAIASLDWRRTGWNPPANNEIRPPLREGVGAVSRSVGQSTVTVNDVVYPGALVLVPTVAPRSSQVPAVGNFCSCTTTPVADTGMFFSGTHFVGVLLLAISRCPTADGVSVLTRKE